MTRGAVAAGALSVAGALALLVPLSPFANGPNIVSRGGVAWSPTRQEIAFGVSVGGRQGIAIAHPDGSRLRLLTPSPDPDLRVTESRDPVWAPDGNRLAFTSSFTDGAGRVFSLVRTVNRDGSGLQTIAEGSSPSWAPDGKRLAFGTLDPTASPSGAAVADLRTGGSASITELGSPVWQPHGELLALTGAVPGDSGNVVVLQRDDGSGRRQLTAGEAPVWSGDGRRLAYDSGNSVYVIHADGTGKRRLVGVRSGSLKAWAPAGDRLAVSDRSGASVVDVATGRVRRVLVHVHGPSAPSWSPDGRQIAFVVGSRIRVARADASGGGLLALRPAASAAATPWLAPVAVARGSGSQVGLGARGGAVVLLVDCCAPATGGPRARAVDRPAGGRFRAPVPVSTPGMDAQYARLATNGRGDAVVAWLSSADGIVDASFRPAGGAFGEVENLSVYSVFAGGEFAMPAVGLDARGDATAAWLFKGPGGHGQDVVSVQAAIRRTGRKWASAKTVTTPATQPAREVALAVDPAGNALLVWTFGPDGSRQVAAAFRPVSGRWQAPVALSSAEEDAQQPQAVLAGPSDGLVVWVGRRDETSTVEAASSSPATDTWRPSQDVSPQGVPAGGPQAAFDARGNALVAWSASFGPGSSARVSDAGVQVASQRAHGSFGPVLTLYRDPAAVGSPRPALAVNARGDAVVAWSGHTDGSGNTYAQAAIRPAGRDFGPVAALGGRNALDPAAAVDARGSAVVVWTEQGRRVLAAFSRSPIVRAP